MGARLFSVRGPANNYRPTLGQCSYMVSLSMQHSKGGLSSIVYSVSLGYTVEVSQLHSRTILGFADDRNRSCHSNYQRSRSIFSERPLEIAMHNSVLFTDLLTLIAERFIRVTFLTFCSS